MSDRLLFVPSLYLEERRWLMDAIDLMAKRRRSALKQWQVAAALGHSSSWLSQIECGVHELTPELASSIENAIDGLGNG